MKIASIAEKKYITRGRNELFNAIFKMDALGIVNTCVLLWVEDSISITEKDNLFSKVSFRLIFK